MKFDVCQRVNLQSISVFIKINIRNKLKWSHIRDEEQQTVLALSLLVVLKRDELKDIQRENTNFNLNLY